MNKKAFTFIEVMIAIVIFSVGILSVLHLVTRNLSAMNRNNSKIQATLLAREGIELLYNIRDSNLKKELSWNCIFNSEMFEWDTEELSAKISRGDKNNFEEVICDGYFDKNNNLKIAFDPDHYAYYSRSDKLTGFNQNYENNKLYYYEDNSGGEDIFWYGYQDDDFTGKDTQYARFLSFSLVKEGENLLPENKILKVESHVLYINGSLTGEVVFESFIGNY